MTQNKIKIYNKIFLFQTLYLSQESNLKIFKIQIKLVDWIDWIWMFTYQQIIILCENERNFEKTFYFWNFFFFKIEHIIKSVFLKQEV